MPEHISSFTFSQKTTESVQLLWQAESDFGTFNQITFWHQNFYDGLYYFPTEPCIERKGNKKEYLPERLREKRFFILQLEPAETWIKDVQRIKSTISHAQKWHEV